MHLWLIGRRRAAVVSVVSFLVVTLISAVINPGLSLGFWRRLATGDTGLGNSIVYSANQSVMGTWLRLFGIGSLAKLCALGASAVVAVLACSWASAGTGVANRCSRSA